MAGSNAVVGMSGKVIFSGAEVVEVTDWGVEPVADTPETSSMSSGGNREYKIGMKGWTGNFNTNNFINLNASVAVGSFYVGSAAASYNPVYSGTVLIKSAPVAATYDGIVKYSHTFQGSGPLTVSIT